MPLVYHPNHGICALLFVANCVRANPTIPSWSTLRTAPNAHSVGASHACPDLRIHAQQPPNSCLVCLWKGRDIPSREVHAICYACLVSGPPRHAKSRHISTTCKPSAIILKHTFTQPQHHFIEHPRPIIRPECHPSFTAHPSRSHPYSQQDTGALSPND